MALWQKVSNSPAIAAQHAMSSRLRKSTLAAFVEREMDSIAIVSICARKNKKSLARNTRHIKPRPFSRRVQAAAA